MKYCVVYKKAHEEDHKRTRFTSHKNTKQQAEFFSRLGFKTLILSKNDFESSYGLINKPRKPLRSLIDMSLLGVGFRDGPPFYNMEHHINTRGFVFSVNKPRMAS